MDNEVKFKAFLIGEYLDTDSAKTIYQMFQNNYFRYHYIDEILDDTRIRFIASLNHEIIGYATAKPKAHLFELSSLLISRSYRGLSYGKALENYRYDSIKKLNKSIYVSCNCDTLASQKLKRQLEMTPCCIKIGYRNNVYRESFVGSAAIFTDDHILLSEPNGYSCSSDDNLLRKRYVVTNEEEIITLLQINKYVSEDYYIDVLTGDVLYKQMLQLSENFVYHGVDIDQDTGKWHYIFQMKNQKYYTGLNFDPEFIFEINELNFKGRSKPLSVT